MGATFLSKVWCRSVVPQFTSRVWHSVFFSFIGTRITTTRNHLQWALAFSPLQAPNIAYMEMPLAALIEHSLALSSWTTPDQVNQVDPILLDCILPNEPVRFIFAKMKLHVTWRRSLKPMLVKWPFWTKGGNLWWSVCYKQIITSSTKRVRWGPASDRKNHHFLMVEKNAKFLTEICQN